MVVLKINEHVEIKRLFHHVLFPMPPRVSGSSRGFYISRTSPKSHPKLWLKFLHQFVDIHSKICLTDRSRRKQSSYLPLSTPWTNFQGVLLFHKSSSFVWLAVSQRPMLKSQSIIWRFRKACHQFLCLLICLWLLWYLRIGHDDSFLRMLYCDLGCPWWESSIISFPDSQFYFQPITSSLLKNKSAE